MYTKLSQFLARKLKYLKCFWHENPKILIVFGIKIEIEVFMKIEFLYRKCKKIKIIFNHCDLVNMCTKRFYLETWTNRRCSYYEISALNVEHMR